MWTAKNSSPTRRRANWFSHLALGHAANRCARVRCTGSTTTPCAASSRANSWAWTTSCSSQMRRNRLTTGSREMSRLAKVFSVPHSTWAAYFSWKQLLVAEWLRRCRRPVVSRPVERRRPSRRAGPSDRAAVARARDRSRTLFGTPPRNGCPDPPLVLVACRTRGTCSPGWPRTTSASDSSTSRRGPTPSRRACWRRSTWPRGGVASTWGRAAVAGGAPARPARRSDGVGRRGLSGPALPRRPPGQRRGAGPRRHP